MRDSRWNMAPLKSLGKQRQEATQCGISGEFSRGGSPRTGTATCHNPHELLMIALLCMIVRRPDMHRNGALWALGGSVAPSLNNRLLKNHLDRQNGGSESKSPHWSPSLCVTFRRSSNGPAAGWAAEPSFSTACYICVPYRSGAGSIPSFLPMARISKHSNPLASSRETVPLSNSGEKAT